METTTMSAGSRGFTPKMEAYEAWSEAVAEKRPAWLLVSTRNPGGRSADTELWFQVVLVDSKFTFGRPRLLVEPFGGVGQQWVDAGKLVLVRPKAFGPKVAEK